MWIVVCILAFWCKCIKLCSNCLKIKYKKGVFVLFGEVKKKTAKSTTPGPVSHISMHLNSQIIQNCAIKAWFFGPQDFKFTRFYSDLSPSFVYLSVVNSSSIKLTTQVAEMIGIFVNIHVYARFEDCTAVLMENSSFLNMTHSNWWTYTSVLKELSSCIVRTVLCFLDFPKMEVASYSTLLVTVSVYVMICSRRLGSSYVYNVAYYMYIVLYKENEMIYYIICYSIIFGVSVPVCSAV